MNEPIRTQWQIRCAFNGFCKLALRREAMNAHRDTKQRQLREIPFSDLSPQEEKQLYVCDEYFTDDKPCNMCWWLFYGTSCCLYW